MSWAANAAKRRAFRVTGEVKSRGVLKLTSWCGNTTEHTPEQLEAAGYKIIQSRPAYAEAGHYTPA